MFEFNYIYIISKNHNYSEHNYANISTIQILWLKTLTDDSDLKLFYNITAKTKIIIISSHWPKIRPRYPKYLNKKRVQNSFV